MENRTTDQVEERSVVKKPGTHHRGGFDRTRQRRSIEEREQGRERTKRREREKGGVKTGKTQRLG